MIVKITSRCVEIDFGNPTDVFQKMAERRLAIMEKAVELSRTMQPDDEPITISGKQIDVNLSAASS